MFKRFNQSPSSRAKIKANKTIVDGITFDSGLEAYMYTLLRDSKIPFEYEGVEYPLINKFDYPAECFERPATGRDRSFIDRRMVRKMIYTPDFVGENEEWIIETKGRANESFPLRWKIFKAIMAKRKKPPMLFLPATQGECREVLKMLKDKGYGSQRHRS